MTFAGAVRCQKMRHLSCVLTVGFVQIVRRKKGSVRLNRFLIYVVALIIPLLIFPYSMAAEGVTKATLHIKMNSAKLYGPGSHVAVWLGAHQSHNQDWIQGGIEEEYGDTHPYIYLETGHNGRQTSFRKTPTQFGTVSSFRLFTSGQYWQVVTNGKLSPVRIRISKPEIQQEVELLDGTVSASINGVLQP